MSKFLSPRRLQSISGVCFIRVKREYNRNGQCYEAHWMPQDALEGPRYILDLRSKLKVRAGFLGPVTFIPARS